MLILLGLASILAHHASSGDPRETVVRTLGIGCYATLGIAALLCLRSLAFGKAAVPHMPPLSFYTIVVYVYGLGLLVFVSVYCLLDLSACRNFYLATLSGIALADLLEKTRDDLARRALLALSTVASALVFAFKASLAPDAEEVFRAFITGHSFVFFFGVALPMTAPFVFLAIRGRRFYAPITVMEFIHLSMPFAVHASVNTLLSLSLVSYSPVADYISLNITLPAIPNSTDWVNSARLVTAADVATPILALLMMPVLFFAVQTTLLYSTTDFVVPAAVVTAFRHFTENQNLEPSTIVILLAASTAFCARIYTCFRDSKDNEGVLYSSELESSDDGGEDKPELLRSLQRAAVADDETAPV